MSAYIGSGVSWVELALMLLGLFAVNEIAYRIAARHRSDAPDARKSQADLVVAALLGLLGLLLAFSFDIGDQRFATRKELVLDEANAIATTYLRADMLPAPHGERVQGLLRQYVEYRSGFKNAADFEHAVARSAALHTDLWREATEAARASPTPIVALFVDSLNKVIDLHESRITVALFQRLPPAIFAVLYFVSLLSLAMVGLRAGFDRKRAAVPAVALVLVIMSVLALIQSLDQPASRLFQISKRALDDTRALMATERPVSSAAR